MNGVMIFKYRQSSLDRNSSPDRAAWGSWYCEACTLKSVQGLTPSHGSTGCVGFHLRAPTGGAAYGIPRKKCNSRLGSANTVPEILPLSNLITFLITKLFPQLFPNFSDKRVPKCNILVQDVATTPNLYSFINTIRRDYKYEYSYPRN